MSEHLATTGVGGGVLVMVGGILVHAQPAELILAGIAGHMVASSIFEDDGCAIWASFTVFIVLIWLI
jgi:hypothetical protein